MQIHIKTTVEMDASLSWVVYPPGDYFPRVQSFEGLNECFLETALAATTNLKLLAIDLSSKIDPAVRRAAVSHCKRLSNVAAPRLLSTAGSVGP